MKRFLLSLVMLTMLTMAQAQTSNLVFFSEQGESFSVVLNGILQNARPETNVKITDLPGPSYRLKIIFDDQNLGEIDKTLMFNQGAETTFAIRKNTKGEYVVRYMNEFPLAQVPPSPPAQQVIVYHADPPVATSTVTTTTTTTGGAAPGMGISINDPSVGANVNVNLNLGMPGVQSTTTTTTTTTSGSSVNVVGNPGMMPGQVVVEERHENSGYPDDRGGHGGHGGHGDRDRYELPGYNGAYGCPWPMAPGDFESAKSSIRSKSFEDSKLTIAKQIIQSNCLLSSQVKEIMLLFSFEDTRLDFAKFAYAYTLDLGNYYKVNDAFTFESSIDELNSYVSGYRR